MPIRPSAFGIDLYWTGKLTKKFSGGTSIHLLYGGYRYSEDLSFAGSAIPESARSHIRKFVAVP
jgi:hypothetical protein